MIFMAEHAQVDEVERRLQCLVPSLQQHEAAADGSVAVVTQALLRLNRAARRGRGRNIRSL